MPATQARTAQQQGKEEQLRGPAQLNEPLLQEHFGQVAGHRDDGAGNDELGRQRRGAQDAQAVARQFGELAGQRAEGLLSPAGLCLGDDGLLHQRKGGGGNALERSAQQVKARKAEEALQRLASEPMALASMEIWELLAETWMYSSSRPSVFRLS